MDDNSELPVNQGGIRRRHQSEEEEEEECYGGSIHEDEDEEHFNFVESSHPVQVLTGLNSLRQCHAFCDVTLCVDGHEFPCHKIVMASFSPYFKAMFSGGLAESTQDRVSINGVEPGMIKLLVDYAYTSEAMINKTNVQSLLSAANLLEVLPVRDACCKFMERHMDETNCLGIHCFAEAHACGDLQEKAKKFTLRYFPDVCQQEEFFSLSSAKLIEFISDDNLSVDSEEVVFDAVMRWLDHDRVNHAQDFYKVSRSSVRL